MEPTTTQLLWFGAAVYVKCVDTTISTEYRRLIFLQLVKGSDVGEYSCHHQMILINGEVQMILALTICETCPAQETDMLIPVMLNLFDSRASLMALLKLVIEREVKSARKSFVPFVGLKN